MKNKLLVWICFLFLWNGHLQAQRFKECINREWTFSLGDHPGAETVLYNDQDWADIGLPHSFSIPYFMSPDFYVGYGWYRKLIDIPENYKGKRISIEFEGVFQVAELYINGKKAGEHTGGYTGFIIDITNYIQTGKNLIAVRVNNIWNPQIAPRAGEHVFSGGIYRDVYLHITDPVHVVWNGTFITTPEVSRKMAVIKVNTEIANHNQTSKEIRIETTLFSPQGKMIDKLTTSTNLKSGEVRDITQQSKAIANPHLWSPDTPELYNAITHIYEKEELKDVYETTFGIRWIEWTSDKGFFLNGEHLYLQGVNAHQDQAGWGDAVTNAGFYRDVQMVKEAGFNFIRGSHYPHDPAYSKACDELGILFWQENVFWGIGGFKEDGYWNSSAYPVDKQDREGFRQSLIQQLKEMIRIHRNHPSIIAWSMSNEPFFTAPETIEPMRELLSELAEISRKLDPSRPAAIGGAQRPLGENRIDKLGDIAGYNGDGGRIQEFLVPGIPNMVSEYGSTTAIRPGNYEPGWGDLAAGDFYKGFPWRSGQAIWCAFDHGSIAGSRLGKMGIIDYFRLPKRAWYWYRNEYAGIAPPEWPEEGIPAKLRLEANRTEDIRTDGTDDVQLTITILDKDGKHISNTPPVELQVISGPGEFPTGKVIRFSRDSDIQILDGQAAMALRSYYAGTTTIRASSPGLESAEIKIEFTGKEFYALEKVRETYERPYIRFIPKEPESSSLTVFGYNNPTFPSSSQKGHLSGLANDGNKETWWEPAKSDKSPYWVIDTEKSLEIKSIQLFFPKPEIYQYSIEGSLDNLHWYTITDKSDNKEKSDHVNIELPQKIKANLLRVNFKNKKPTPRISEVEIIGRMIE